MDLMQAPVLVSDGGPTSIELSGRRDRILHRLQVNLRQHPAIKRTQFQLTRLGNDHELVGQFDTRILADGCVRAESAKLVINWWTHPDGIDDQFVFHYSEPAGFDCGWHRQPHPNEPDIPFDHFQYRFGADDEYQYKGVDFIEDDPIGLFWEVSRTRLPKILQWRWGEHEE